MASTTKPLIGINADFKPSQKTSAPAISFLFSGYYDSVLKAGGVPIIIPPYQEVSEIDQVLDLLDGIIMVGGADLDPRNDGFMLHPSIRLMAERREQFDRALFARVYERRLPFFGIGAGMQLMNVALGGTLFLHIPEDLNKALPHRDAMDPFHRHSLIVEKNSLFDHVYGDNEIRVNSIHHMAIDDVAPGFLATAKCPDFVIEGIESISDDWFAFGTQFHPEAASATALDQKIFHEFIRGILKQKTKKSVAQEPRTRCSNQQKVENESESANVFETSLFATDAEFCESFKTPTPLFCDEKTSDSSLMATVVEF
ncbi:MAG: gamma-glutamyl-gamma-aminobutyrate hydrolase family protein [Planctomycetia bacterium]|nr:gamma-glutamyl-gamma-aminobutyrate hydrolase family protein [Planctomycetia bacterium]